VFVGALMALASSGAGCGATDGNPITGSTTASSSGSGGGAGGNTGGDGGTTFSGPGGFGGGCPVHCSADLHQVLDCNDNVILECPPDQGCGPGGECIDPCASANENKSTLGCDFYSAIPGPEYETRGSCFAALIANTWTTPVSIAGSWGGATGDGATIARIPVGQGNGLTYQPLTNGQLQPGEVAIVFLAQYNSNDIFHVPCPSGVQALVTGAPTEVDGTGIGEAIRIQTDRPIVAYDIFPWGGASSFVSSATLLIPTSAWGDNYVAVDAWEANPSLAFVNGFPHVQIVAAEDNTEVTIAPTAAIVGGPGVAGTGQGVPVTYTLNAGQMLQLQQPERLIGSIVQSGDQKPISVWGGTACMNIPIGTAACDAAHQQLSHVQALGSSYVGVQYRPRLGGAEESVPYTLVGAVDGTQLSWDPAPPAGAPTTLDSGQFVVFNASEQFSLSGQDEEHPFYLAIHMTGGSLAGGIGDPEYVNVVTPQQWLDEYLFVTDPTYANTNLVFVRKRNEDMTFSDVTLDCVGILSGWTPVGASGDYEFARVDLVANGAPQGTCDNGAHTAESESPFGLTVWGFDQYASYGYPGGMSVKPINTVVLPPIPQ
jgi:IgGFc binding protein